MGDLLQQLYSSVDWEIFADLKPNNIVFAHQDLEDLEVKIIDFGLAKDLAEETDIPISTCGTPEFTSPGQSSEIQMLPSN